MRISATTNGRRLRPVSRASNTLSLFDGASSSRSKKRRLATIPKNGGGWANFVVIGGGPTGVELSGAIAELAKNALAKDFRNIDPQHARIILVEAGPRLLTAFPEELSAHAKAALER